MHTEIHRKEKFEDLEVLQDVAGEELKQKVFTRVYAVNKTFKDSSFKQSVFDGVYFRNCTFIRCDFTGAEFRSSTLRGSKFEGCKFHYSRWEKTLLDDNFLNACLPSEENLARDLVRDLRINYGHFGNYPMVNRAASLEVKLTGVHFFKAAYSSEAHYRLKHKGLERFRMAISHAKWKALDLLWGNGESIFRVALSTAAFVIAVGLLSSGSPVAVADSVKKAFETFLGSGQPLPLAHTAILVVSRYVFFGLFMAILVKRLSRR